MSERQAGRQSSPVIMLQDSSGHSHATGLVRACSLSLPSLASLESQVVFVYRRLKTNK